MNETHAKYNLMNQCLYQTLLLANDYTANVKKHICNKSLSEKLFQFTRYPQNFLKCNIEAYTSEANKL